MTTTWSYTKSSREAFEYLNRWASKDKYNNAGKSNDWFNGYRQAVSDIITHLMKEGDQNINVMAKNLLELAREHKKHCESEHCKVSLMLVGQVYSDLRQRKLTKKELEAFV